MRRVPLARRNLFQDRRRAVLSVSGLAVAFVLVLVLDGVFAGALVQVTAYLRNLSADVVVSQQGVRTMHMSSSAVPPETVARVRRVPGVATATAIRFTTNAVHAGDGRQLSYVIGYDTASNVGGPHHLASGRAPGPGEAILDQAAADQLGARVGSSISLLGRTFRISGLSTGGTSITNTTTFIRTEDFAALRGPAVSYILVTARSGVNSTELARRIEATVAGTSAQTRAAMVDQEGHIVRDMSADIMQIMTFIGLLIALAVVALTLFTATLAKLRDYAVVKALGARPRRLVVTVLAQAGWTIALAFVAAVLVTLAIAAVVAGASPTVRLAIDSSATARLAIGAVVVGLIGAVLPLHRVLAVDPTSSFRSST